MVANSASGGHLTIETSSSAPPQEVPSLPSQPMRNVQSQHARLRPAQLNLTVGWADKTSLRGLRSDGCQMTGRNLDIVPVYTATAVSPSSYSPAGSSPYRKMQIIPEFTAMGGEFLCQLQSDRVIVAPRCGRFGRPVPHVLALHTLLLGWVVMPRNGAQRVEHGLADGRFNVGWIL